MSMAIPKNKDNLNLGLAAVSAVGGALLFYAYTGGRISKLNLPVDLVTFAMVSGGLYGLGFFLAPKVLIEMNFSAPVDKYHEFVARFSGIHMVLMTYFLYGNLFVNPFQVACLWMGCLAFLGPTQAALYMEPKQTATGHIPAHVLFFLGGVLAVTS